MEIQMGDFKKTMVICAAISSFGGSAYIGLKGLAAELQDRVVVAYKAASVQAVVPVENVDNPSK
jgi:hypothetical protein